MMKIEEIASEFKKYDSALIFCHTRPDGDTLGSAFALRRLMESAGKRADIVCDDPVPTKYSFIPEAGRVFSPSEVVGQYAAHIALDCSVEGMVGEGYALFKKNRVTFNIDHHISNSRYALYNYVEGLSSCSEIMYDFLKLSGFTLDGEAATCLLLGISTDTGHFMHDNVTAKTLAVASALVAAGGDLHGVGQQMFKRQSASRAKLYAQVMSKMEFYLDGRLAVITINKKDMEDLGVTRDMTEGFIDFPLSVDGVEVAISIMESKDKCFKISYRSKGRVDVNEIASVFGGGGHILASGCMLHGFYEDVKEKLVRTVSLYI
ncbi:MAG: bifunctional oligoribonuclease/PAP phosphatase NrnA [Clostridia bacterium]|nr:bifunctional oligoribonuclease/PAP phosphatase NrnA [Clostridia bacterium]